MCQKKTKAWSSLGFLTWRRECLEVLHGLLFSGSRDHELASSGFNHPLLSISLSLSAECSYVHGIFFQLPNVFLWHYLSSPQQKDCRKKRSGFIKVAV